jgi:hypothetical protein
MSAVGEFVPSLTEEPDTGIDHVCVVEHALVCLDIRESRIDAERLSSWLLKAYVWSTFPASAPPEGPLPRPVEPASGVEPLTCRLQGGCSAN